MVTPWPACLWLAWHCRDKKIKCMEQPVQPRQENMRAKGASRDSKLHTLCGERGKPLVWVQLSDPCLQHKQESCRSPHFESPDCLFSPVTSLVLYPIGHYCSGKEHLLLLGHWIDIIVGFLWMGLFWSSLFTIFHLVYPTKLFFRAFYRDRLVFLFFHHS